ncbi:MAG TPA: PAS domain S-box protein [Candidatus Acidoferrum sp.]|jgi:PAS domain S-box-containing protein|nr:PAS domain S-box protein [Candidatus Acidoferrum sp.]
MNTLGKITERATLKAEVLAKFIDAIPVAFIVADGNGDIYLINRQTELLFGYDQTELVGNSVEMLVPDALREAHAKHRTSYVDEPHIRPMGTGLQLSAKKKNGIEFPAEISLGPLVTTDGLYIVVMVVRRREAIASA